METSVPQPGRPPPEPACPTCAPFIWTAPIKAPRSTPYFSFWPFSPTWLSIQIATAPAATLTLANASTLRQTATAPVPPGQDQLVPATPIGSVPKLSTSHLTVPSTPKVTPSLPWQPSPTTESKSHGMAGTPAGSQSSSPSKGSENPAVTPSPSPADIANAMVLTLSVHIDPAECFCGVMRCPEDKRLVSVCINQLSRVLNHPQRAACSAFASKQCTSECVETTRFYTTTVNAAEYFQAMNATRPSAVAANATLVR